MGSIDCPNCAHSVSDAMDECPWCGTTLPENTAPATTPQTGIVFDSSRPVQTPFFAVSLLKLAVLSTCTCGLYELYWFWRNWNRIRVNGEPEITPSLRAFFGIFYCYPCFIRIKLAGISRGVIPAPSYRHSCDLLCSHSPFQRAAPATFSNFVSQRFFPSSHPVLCEPHQCSGVAQP